MFKIPTTVDVPDGSYTATLAEVEEGDGNFGKFRRWHWLVEVGAEIIPLTQLTSVNTGPQSKSFKQLAALLGKMPQAGEELASPNGARAVVTVTHNDKGFPTISDVGPYVDPQQALPGIPR